MQNMMLAAWNEGVVSCPNGMPDAEAAARVLGLEDGLLPVNIPSFGYPKRDLAPESKTADEWSAEANRKPLDDLVRRV
jgi:nitroreductase